MSETRKIRGGMITALLTPFKDNKVDYDSLKKLINFQVNQGVEGFVISGTTAESPNLTKAEVEEIFKFARENTPEDFQLILGAGTNSTWGTIDKVKGFEHLNPDAYLIVTPYYNKPTQAGILEHFKSVALATERDILLYDVPGRTVVDISVETTSKLAEFPNIIGVKDATGDLGKLKELKRSTPEGFLLLSGDDDTAVDFMKQGGHGVISVLSHVIPMRMKNCWEGQEDFAKYAQLCTLLFSEPNPTPVKACLKLMGIIDSAELRLPLLEATESLKMKLKDQIKMVGIANRV